MAKPKDEDIRALFTPYLEPGEQLEYTAYGIHHIPLIFIILILCIPVLSVFTDYTYFALYFATFTLLAAVLHFTTTHYFVGLTSGRLLTLVSSQGTNPKKAKITETLIHHRTDLSADTVKTSQGGIFNHMHVKTGPKTFKAKFHRAYNPSNRPNAAAIAEAISSTKTA